MLIVEDEARLGRNIAQALRETASFAADISLDGEDGLHMALSEEYDLILLDLMLPKLGGLEILRELREAGRRTPVLIMTARDSTEDVVRGLNEGGDDYLTKPFEMAELVARCRAMVRRSYNQPDPVVRVGGLAVDTTSRRVSWQGRRMALSAMEYRLLEYLALREGEIVSKEDIVEHLYDFGAENFSNVVEVYISALRRKLAEGGGRGLIRTVRGRGYVLEEPAA